jgi:LCP family protein required for cell wall assembly
VRPRGSIGTHGSAPASGRRAAGAALLSFLLPGLGQAYNRDWALATVLAAPVALIALLAILVITSDAGDALSQLLDQRVLAGLIVLDLSLLAWRIVAIVQAHAARIEFSARAWPTWVTAALVIGAVATHAVPAYYAAKGVDTLGSMALEGRGGSVELGAAGGFVLPAPTFEPDLERGQRLTVLLVGVDFIPGRTHHLTDTILVATFDPRTRSGAMVSIPRDMYGVPLGDGRTYDAKINSLLSRAATDPEAYPLGGPATLKAAIGELLGTRIHYFAAVDIEGLKRVIDAIGGVDVLVEYPISDPTGGPTNGGLYLDSGMHHFDGDLALAYARSRKGAGESDFTRAARQQILLAAMGQKLTAGNVLLTLPSLLDAMKASVATDVPSARISELARTAQKVDFGALERIVLTPPDFVTPDPNSPAGYILVPDLEAIRQLGERVFGEGSAPE